jgi:hypothetical protein
VLLETIFLEFLTTSYQDLIDELPLALIIINMWLQMDDALAHHAIPVRNWLNEYFDERCIGRDKFDKTGKY